MQKSKISKSCNSESRRSVQPVFQNITVTCVGAGREQLGIIQFAQSLGLRVIAVDGNDTAIGLAIADSARVIDLNDTSSVCEWLQSQDTKALLPSPLGASLQTVGAINDELNLCGISESAAIRCVDKLKFHATMCENSISVPHQKFANDFEGVLTVSENVGWPVIVKPQFGSGSRGVFVVNSPNQLSQLYYQHYYHNINCLHDGVIVQEYLEGQEVGVDGAVIDGIVYILLIRDKSLTPLPYRVGVGYFTPTSLSKQKQDKVVSVSIAAARAIGLNNCLFHADIIVSKRGDPVILEMSGRPSGYDLCLRMIPAVIGINPLEIMIDHILGRNPKCIPPSQVRGGVLRMIESSPGIVRRIQGIEMALAIPGIISGQCYVKSGHRILNQTDGPSSYIGYLLAVDDNRRTAEARWAEAAKKIQIDLIPD